MIERLDGSFNRGYTQALMDLLEDLDGAYNDCKHHKISMNNKQLKKYIACRIENRERLRENLNGFIRYNGNIKDWEWFDAR